MLALVLLLGLAAAPMPVLSTQAEAASASGQAIVNKAREYLGKVPYVYGGKTIDGSNPGADCSGFICRIYVWDPNPHHFLTVRSCERLT